MSLITEMLDVLVMFVYVYMNAYIVLPAQCMDSILRAMPSNMMYKRELTPQPCFSHFIVQYSSARTSIKFLALAYQPHEILPRPQQPSLPNSTQRHPTRHPLHTLPRLQNSPIRRQEHALARPRQSRNITTCPCPRDLVQIVRGQPYPPRRLADELHMLEHRLIIPVLEPEP